MPHYSRGKMQQIPLNNIDLGCFLRRVPANLVQQTNFGPNVVYSVLGTLLMCALREASLQHSNVPKLPFSGY